MFSHLETARLLHREILQKRWTEYTRVPVLPKAAHIFFGTLLLQCCLKWVLISRLFQRFWVIQEWKLHIMNMFTWLKLRRPPQWACSTNWLSRTQTSLYDKMFRYNEFIKPCRMRDSYRVFRHLKYFGNTIIYSDNLGNNIKLLYSDWKCQDMCSRKIP